MPVSGTLLLRGDGLVGRDVPIDQNATDAVILRVGEFLHGADGGQFGADGKMSVGSLITKLTEYFGVNIRELVDELGGIDQVVATAQLAYRTYVAPFDIPGIPNLIEPAVDGYLELAVGLMIRRAYAQMKAQPVPVPTPAVVPPVPPVAPGTSPAPA
jgi:hypothetical protein